MSTGQQPVVMTAVPQSHRRSTSRSRFRSRSRSRSSGRTISSSQEISPNCICHRPHGMVFCKYCGWMTKGRVRFQCPEHLRTMYLLDIDQCPKCRAFPPILTETVSKC